MKILFIGVMEKPESTNVAMVKALRQLGHDVIEWNYRAETEGMDAVAASRALIWEYNEKPQIDLIFFCKMDSRFQDAMNYIAAEFDDSNKMVYWFPDPVMTAMSGDYDKLAGCCGHIFATTSKTVKYFRQSLACQYSVVHDYQPEGYDPDIYYKQESGKTSIYVFVGSKNPERETEINLNGYKGGGLLNDIECYGSGWSNAPVYLEQEAKVFNQAEYVLNLHRGHGYSDRVTKAIACGARVVTTLTEDIVEQYYSALVPHESWQGYYVLDPEWFYIETWQSVMENILMEIV